MVSLELAPEFGYVLLVGVLYFFVLMWKGFQIGKIRKKYNIAYPKMYDEKCNEFNCYQRAHQNSLEALPQFYFLLLTAGVKHPVYAAVFGLIYVISRIVYALGYYTGDPKNRVKGAFGYIALLGLLFCTLNVSYSLLTSA
eukprot:Nk52_evm41s967 gene=Nk52_evmTU41s967